MTESEYSAYMSRDELAAKLRAHHESLLSETGEMGKNATRTKLETILKIYMNPFVEEADSATEYAGFHGAAVTYLAMCRRHVMPLMPPERQEQMLQEWAELEGLVRAHEQAEHRSTQTLVHSVYELASCIDRAQGALAEKLEEIRCALNSINTTLQPVSTAAEGSAMLGGLLSHIDYVLTDSMESLVGPLPPQPLPPQPLPPQPPPTAQTAAPGDDKTTTSVENREREAVSHAN